MLSKYAEKCLVALPQVMKLGCRREKPTLLEAQATAKGEGIPVRAYLVDGRHITIKIDAWTTALDLADALGSELGGVSRGDGLRVFEVSDEALQERCLDDDERVLDVLAYWDRMQLQDKKKRRKSAHFKLMYKVRYFYTDALSSPCAEELHYQQARQDILDERYPCSLPEACTLAALALQEQYGDRNEHSLRVVQGHLSEHVPPSARSDRDLIASLEQRILKLYGKLRGIVPRTRGGPTSPPVERFRCMVPPTSRPSPRLRNILSQVVLAVTATSLLVVDPSSRAVLKSFSYGSVVTWGHSSSSFVVVEGDEVSHTKVQFATPHGREMNDLIRAYVEAQVPSRVGRTGMLVRLLELGAMRLRPWPSRPRLSWCWGDCSFPKTRRKRRCTVSSRSFSAKTNSFVSRGSGAIP